MIKNCTCGGNCKNRNTLKDIVKINPTDQEMIDAVLNGYTVCVFHNADGKETAIFSKP